MLLTGQDSTDEISLLWFQGPCQHSQSCLDNTSTPGSPEPLEVPKCPPAACQDDSTTNKYLHHVFHAPSFEGSNMSISYTFLTPSVTCTRVISSGLIS